MKRFVLGKFGTKEMYVPEKHYHMIRNNWNAGKIWWLCSPILALSRTDIAKIVTSHPSELI